MLAAILVPPFVIVCRHRSLFRNTNSVLMRDTFPVCCLKWADVPPEYIEVVKGSLQWFVLDFTDQAHLLDLLNIKCSACGKSSGAIND
ncbi:(R)-mandelonitrile lyase 1-like [Cucumis melo var. makuwa]|uniref:(R)-mandelonitrile lyase 1-like n=1 Tax=Cucumis melo var. makuwa TaxID=1194695 RepID=A0A5D3CX28_CUCMM|nr:(R)-mandelonitrile lyase 1-like [Cucumis melo var. makuwa]